MRISLTNRATPNGWVASGSSRLIATGRPMSTSSARSTTPMPPVPSTPTLR
jgi:hypothetical protein